MASTFSNAQKAKQALPDSTQIKNSVTGFYKWYVANWEKTAAFKLYKGKGKKDAPPYIIDWKAVERYFTYLRNNAPNLSEAFLKNERAIYQESEEAFKKYPEDELPSGFDYDHFTNSQEEPGYFMQELLKKGNKWVITMLPDNKAHVNVLYKEGDVFFCGDMVKEKSGWKISGVACESNSAETEQKN